MAEEGSGAWGTEGAVGVVADVSGAGVEEGVGDFVEGIGGYEDDEFAELGDVSCGSEGLAGMKAEGIGEHVVGAAVGDIEGGVGGIEGDAASDGVEDKAGVDAFEGIEDWGVIGNDGVGGFALGLVGDGGGVVDGEEDLVELLGGVSDEESDVVPGLGETGGRDLFEEVNELSEQHVGMIDELGERREGIGVGRGIGDRMGSRVGKVTGGLAYDSGVARL